MALRTLVNGRGFIRAIYAQGKFSLSTSSLRLADSPAKPTYDKDNEFLIVRPGVRAKIIDGKKIAARVQMEVKEEVVAMARDGKRPPFLAAVLVGDNPASKAYISNKTKAAKKCGIETTTILRDSSISQDELMELVTSLNKDDKVGQFMTYFSVYSLFHDDITWVKGIAGSHVMLLQRDYAIPCTLVPIRAESR